MNKILVPIDFSVYSENALQTAAHLAKKHNAEILVLHMLEIAEGLSTKSDGKFAEQAVFYTLLAKQKIQKFLSKPYLKDITVTPIIKSNRVFSEINEFSKSKEVDLIIIGSKGSSGLEEIFVGSNTEKVVRNSEIPVLVVKSGPIVTDFNKAIFGCDFFDMDIESYKKAEALTKLLGCSIKLVNINTPTLKFKTTTDLISKAKEFLVSIGKDESMVDQIAFEASNSIEEGIFEYVRREKIDLIILITHGRKGIFHFFTGSIAEDIANHSGAAVLTLKKSNK